MPIYQISICSVSQGMTAYCGSGQPGWGVLAGYISISGSYFLFPIFKFLLHSPPYYSPLESAHLSFTHTHKRANTSALLLQTQQLALPLSVSLSLYLSALLTFSISSLFHKVTEKTQNSWIFPPAGNLLQQCNLCHSNFITIHRQ